MNAHAPRPLPLMLAPITAIEQRRADLHGTYLRSPHITVRILPGATAEQRIALATALLAGTGARIAAKET